MNTISELIEVNESKLKTITDLIQHKETPKEDMDKLNKYILELSENDFNKGKYRKCCTQKCSATGRQVSLEHKEKTSKTLISLSTCNVY